MKYPLSFYVLVLCCIFLFPHTFWCCWGLNLLTSRMEAKHLIFQGKSCRHLFCFHKVGKKQADALYFWLLVALRHKTHSFVVSWYHIICGLMMCILSCSFLHYKHISCFLIGFAPASCSDHYFFMIIGTFCGFFCSLFGFTYSVLVVRYVFLFPMRCC